MENRINDLEDRISHLEKMVSIISEQNTHFSNSLNLIVDKLGRGDSLNEKFVEDLEILFNNYETHNGLIQDLARGGLDYSRIFREMFEKHDVIVASLNERLSNLEK